ncbi:MAG: HAD hydrolase-like protein [Clostridiaceae bacterium]|nr:HAD hydrolase-like protein [Clostridiaceae bacterium]
MKRFTRRSLFLLLTAALCLLLAGCWGSDPLAEENGDLNGLLGLEGSDTADDVVPITSFALPILAGETLDPIDCGDGVQQLLLPLLYEGLFELDPSFEPQPVLCESYTHSEDFTVWTFQVRSVSFSDGSALSAADVAAALQRAKTSARYGARLSSVSSIRVQNGAVEITLSQPNNRFPALLETFRLMENRKDMKDHFHELPAYEGLKDFCRSAKSYSNQELRRYMETQKGTFLEELLYWSEGGDRRMKKESEGNQPFPHVKRALERMSGICDTMIVSAAASSALEFEWGQCGILEYMDLCAGQEHGSKIKQLSAAGKKGYPQGHALMIGDSPGDLKAAKENGMLFYPIVPRDEALSWKEFSEKVFDAFLDGRYEGEWERKLIGKFMEAQPACVLWETLDGEVSIQYEI